MAPPPVVYKIPRQVDSPTPHMRKAPYPLPPCRFEKGEARGQGGRWSVVATPRAGWRGCQPLLFSPVMSTGDSLAGYGPGLALCWAGHSGPGQGRLERSQYVVSVHRTLSPPAASTAAPCTGSGSIPMSARLGSLQSGAGSDQRVVVVSPCNVDRPSVTSWPHCTASLSLWLALPILGTPQGYARI